MVKTENVSLFNQQKIETSLLKCKTLFKCRVEIHKISWKIRIKIITIFKTMYWMQYGFAKRSQERRWQNQKNRLNYEKVLYFVNW